MVGVVFATLVVGMVFCIRRYRRIRQREKWLAEMHPQFPSSLNDDPFRDDNVPAMRSIVTTSSPEDGHWDRKGLLTPGSSSYDHQHLEANVPVMYPIFYDGTFNQRPVDTETSMEPNRVHFRHSKASTPSIYSVSVAPGEGGEVSNDIIVPNLNRSATASNIPPRPPRSHLRDRSKSLGFTLPTPSGSESSNQTSPISESRPHVYNYVLDRKIIPDVCPKFLYC